ncbi:MAG: hypothetical protein A2X59_03635 [Nitrospirae bacterium GWC2_42_7]|nr:MAG: hypothetical protein A2X59_03635 [Nitrospirae bacterium GWC2_42_7]
MTADELFEKGLLFLREKNTLSALASLEKAYALKKTPAIMSFLGFCISQERGQITEAISLCENAILQEPDNSLFYLNLGKVYLKAGDKPKSLETLRKGLSVGKNDEIRMLLERIGNRKTPPFPFLRRSNLLNRITGFILTRLRLR